MAETTTARVPAWKRLGLKLKFAQETTPAAAPVKSASTLSTPQQQPPAKVVSSNSHKRDRDEPSAPEAPAKRVKSQSYERPVPIPTRQIVAPEPYVPKRYGFAGISAEPTGKKTVFDDDDEYTTPITTAPISTEEPDEPVAKTIRPSLRKSVSFTPDTKQKDGETGQKYFKAWASGEDPTAVDPSVEEPASPSKPPTEQTEKPVKEPKQKKAKKPKKSKSTTIDSKSSKFAAAGDKAEIETGETPAYVDYLQQYHSDKSNWKFNKKKQNDLLKNLFNIKRLPAKYDSAIIAYVAGLQGVARDRLAAQAEEVLKKIYAKEGEVEGDAMSLGSRQARKAAYYAALMRYIEQGEARGSGRDEYSDVQLNSIREEAQEGKRAQALLENGLMMALYPDQMAAASATTTATPVPEPATRVEKTKRRKRKTRTAGSASSDDSSSSDNSTSDSDSDSDSDGDNSKSTPRAPIFGKELLDQAFPKTKRPLQPAVTKTTN